jgi:hypothetical protein
LKDRHCCLLNNMSSCSIHVTISDKISSFYRWIVSHCVYLPHFYLFTQHLGWFHALAIVTSAAINVCVQVSPWYNHFISFGYIPRSGVGRSYSNCIFSFLRNPQFSMSILVHIPTNSAWELPISAFVIFCFVFLIIAVLTGVRCYLILGCLFAFCSTGVWAQDLTRARQVLYHLGHSTSPVLSWVFLR